jgi:hypothetical protein
VITPASNYSQSVHRLPNPRVPLRSSCRGLRQGAFGSSIGPSNLRKSTDFSSAPARVFFPDEKPPLLCLGFLRFFVFPSVQGLPHSLLTFPGGGAPPPSVSPPVEPLFPLPGGGRWCQPRSRAPPGGGGRALCGRTRGRPARPDIPCTAPSSSLPLSSMDRRKKMRGRRRYQFYKFSPRELQYGLKHS